MTPAGTVSSVVTSVQGPHLALRSSHTLLRTSPAGRPLPGMVMPGSAVNTLLVAGDGAMPLAELRSKVCLPVTGCDRAAAGSALAGTQAPLDICAGAQGR